RRPLNVRGSRTTGTCNLMKSRRWLLPAIILVLLLGVVFLPMVGPGREWVLQRAIGFLEDAGYQLDYDSSQGSLWTGVTLNGAEFRGSGVDVTVARARIGYFLPGLLTGELPVSLDFRTVRGKVAVAELVGGADTG